MICNLYVALVVFVCVLLIYKYLLDVNLVNVKWVVLIAVVFLLGLFVFINTTHNVPYDIYILFGGVSVPAFCVAGGEKKLKRILLYPLVYIELSHVLTLISYFVASIMQEQQAYLAAEDKGRFIIYSIGLGVVSLLVISSKKITESTGGTEISRKLQFAFMTAGIVISFALCAAAQRIEHGKSSFFDWTVIVKMINLFSVFFLVISVWLLLTYRRNVEYREQISLYNDYMVKQENFINSMIESDEMNRRLRHDMTANINALSAFIEEKDYEGLKTYIRTMQDNNDKLIVKRYSGIAAVDAVVNGLINKYGLKDNEFFWTGNIVNSCKIEVYDLCVLISNLISNAVEACISDGLEKSIEVSILSVGDSFSAVVKNPTKLSNGVLPDFKTRKEDKRNHGYGIKNMKDTLKKYGGELSFKNENNKISAIVVA